MVLNPSSDSDLLKPIKKKFKHLKAVPEDGDEDMNNSDAVDDGFVHVHDKSSYRDKLTGSKDPQHSCWKGWVEEGQGDEMQFDEEISDDESDSNQTPCVGGNVPRVCFTKEEKQAMRSPWRKALTVKLLGKWVSNFNPSLDKINKIIVWIHFSGLPTEYYNNLLLSRMGIHVGGVIHIDRNIVEALRGRFARLCFELDLTKSLLSKEACSSVVVAATPTMEEPLNRFVGLTERFLDDATEEIVEMKKSTGGEGPSFMQRIPNKDKLENIAKPSLRKQKDQHGMVNFKVVEPMVTISHGKFPKFTFQAVYRRTPIHKELRPFCFEVAWLSNVSFLEFIRNILYNLNRKSVLVEGELGMGGLCQDNHGYWIFGSMGRLVHHIYRGANFCVDFLDKKAQLGEFGVIKLQSLPAGLPLLLQDDLVGVTRPRVVID
ncbi:Uncharacterized protein TCM_002733 [Theobroma cacao]|uniref:Uncharacterized protein n=1 Tax=Theobroma cacao TaxID=3641 RepID=A0A061DUX5_THECC|nr:Uncharacterized protein TCM_002733 [Theobroma cacao]